MAMPTWITEFQALSGTIVTISAVAVAIAGWRVARQQLITARQKLRLDLYPYRLSVYQAAHRAVISAINFSNEGVMFDEATAEFRAPLTCARFLFGADAFDYLEKLLTTLLQHSHFEVRLRNDPTCYSGVHFERFREQHQTNEAFILESLKGLYQKLGAYLQVEEGLKTSLVITLYDDAQSAL